MPRVSTGLRGLLGVFQFGSKHTTAQAAHISLWCDTYAILVRCLENNITTLPSFSLPLLVLTLDDDPTGGGILRWQLLLLDFLGKV